MICGNCKNYTPLDQVSGFCSVMPETTVSRVFLCPKFDGNRVMSLYDANGTLTRDGVLMSVQWREIISPYIDEMIQNNVPIVDITALIADILRREYAFKATLAAIRNYSKIHGEESNAVIDGFVDGLVDQVEEEVEE